MTSMTGAVTDRALACLRGVVGGRGTGAVIPGSGVGLYIVKSIIDELDGKIEVKSEVNLGTTFIIHLKLPDVQKLESA